MDIEQIAKEYFWEGVFELKGGEHDKTSLDFALEICRWAKGIPREVWNVKERAGTGRVDQRVLFNTETRNQRKAVEPVVQQVERKLPGEVATVSIGQWGDQNPIAFYPLSLLGIHSIPSICRRYFCNPEERRIFNNFTRRLIRFAGMYWAYRLVFRSSPSVEVAVFSNDHSPASRSFFLAAKEEGICTAYIPHASVSDTFPKLEADLAFLYGKDMLRKYESCGISDDTEIFLVGVPDMDRYIQETGSGQSEIGIAYNLLDDIQAVDQLVRAILNQRGELGVDHIHVRPHPRDQRRLSVTSDILSYSDAEKDISYEYLSGKRLLITGESNIALESASMGVPVLLYNFKDNFRDNYGFIRDGLFERYFEGTEEIADVIRREREDLFTDFDRVSYYNAAVGTDFYGASSRVIAEKILDHASET